MGLLLLAVLIHLSIGSCYVWRDTDLGLTIKVSRALLEIGSDLGSSLNHSRLMVRAVSCTLS